MIPERCGCGSVAMVLFELYSTETGIALEHGPAFVGCREGVCAKRRRASFAAVKRAKLYTPEGSVDVRIRAIHGKQAETQARSSAV